MLSQREGGGRYVGKLSDFDPISLCELNKSEIYELLKLGKFMESKLNYKFSHFYFRKWQSLKGRVVSVCA